MKTKSFDPIKINILQQALGILPDEMLIPSIAGKLQDIAGYFGDMSDSEIKKVIREITMGKLIEDKLSHVWSFCELCSDREYKLNMYEQAKGTEASKLKKELDSISDEIDLYYN